jgi:hypothetical protein
MSETAASEVGSAMPVSASTGSGSPSPGRREVSPEGTTTAPGIPPLATTPAPGPAHSGPRCAGSAGECICIPTRDGVHYPECPASEARQAITSALLEEMCESLDAGLAAIFRYPVRKPHRA